MPNKYNFEKYDWEVKAADYLRKLKNPRGKPYYRCGSCLRRKTLARELWQYVRPPSCECGRVHWMLDMERYNNWKNKLGVFKTCKCDGLSHPHRISSSVWCKEHPTGPTEKDHLERYGSPDESFQSTEEASFEINSRIEETLFSTC